MTNRRRYLRIALLVFGITVWSSAVHAGIMAVQSITDASERGHLLGDVPALVIVAIVLGVLTPRRKRT